MDSWIAVRLAVVIQLWGGSVRTSILHCESTAKQSKQFLSGESGNLPSIYY